MITFVCALAVCLAYQYWLRQVYFYRKPVLSPYEYADPPRTLYSPVEGRVVYVREIVGGQTPYLMEQKGVRKLPVPEELVPGRKYYQVGIFMTPFNNHHLMTPSSFLHPAGQQHLEGASERMWDAKDDWYMILGKWWMNWWEKKIGRYLVVNRRTRFHMSDDVIMDLIYDKYVSKFTPMYEPLGGRCIIGFVGRGSQVDMFIPAERTYLMVGAGDRVRHDSWLGIYTE
jgi:hypothetical protein